MTLENEYKLFVEAYYGIELMDEYELKEYALKKIKELITNFENNYINIDYKELREFVKEKVDDKTKLQSALIVLNSINYDMDLILLIKKRLKNLQN